MTIKISNEGIRKEKLGGNGVGGAMFFYLPIPDTNGAFTMASRVELEEGASISYHKHTENEEIYHIVSGQGIYCEEGEEIEVKAGDMMLCRKGCSHGLKNTGQGKLVFGALIAKRD